MQKVGLVLFLLAALAFVVSTNIWLRRRAQAEAENENDAEHGNEGRS